MKALLAAVVIFGLVSVAVPLSAHHSWPVSYDKQVTVKGKEMSVQLRFHAIWAKRAAGVQFISWQATRFPPKQ